MKRTSYEVYDIESDPMMETYDTKPEAEQRLREMRASYPNAYVVRTVRTRVGDKGGLERGKQK